MANSHAGEPTGQTRPHSLMRPVSPPRKRQRTDAGTAANPHVIDDDASSSSEDEPISPRQAVFPSPFRLTRIRDLSSGDNVDTVSLADIVGDPLISECWSFNFLHDIGFLLDALDQDVRALVKVHVVHGFWKRDDPSRLALQEDSESHGNVELHAAHMPEMFGTHHSKMFVLLRHDDTAQVVIHTANVIPKDWANMTNGVWISPRLPLLPEVHDGPAAADAGYESLAEGSGEKFKADLISYLRAYDDRRPVCRPLVDRLRKHDFSSVRGTLVASVPGRHDFSARSRCTWGWAAMRRALQSVPLQEGDAQVVVQMSSIATLGPTDAWLQRTLFDSLAAGQTTVKDSRPQFKIVFPTCDEIRRSLAGYSSGGSIHTKIQSAQQAKQLQYQKPLLYHWANDSPRGKALDKDALRLDARRNRAAPHIKTYIRYGPKSIDWALLTSANLSKQAWGEATGAGGQTRIASWEVGVLVWPELFAARAHMTAVATSDTPLLDSAKEAKGRPVVGLRVPYNLPLQQYGDDEVPWVATLSYAEPDWKGNTWPR